MNRSRVLLTMLAAVTVLSAGGCLVTSRNKVRVDGPAVSTATLDQIKLGQTTETWLVAALGAPTSATKADESMKVLRYSHTRTERYSGSVFLLLRNDNSKTAHETTCFEITDGVVSRYWKERG